jgi:hypothetical protein
MFHPGGNICMRPTVKLVSMMLILAACVSVDTLTAALAQQATVTHRLDILIDPADHSLAGIDRVIVTDPGRRELVFRLSARVTLQEVLVNDQPCETLFESGLLHVLWPIRNSPAECRW